MKKTLTEKLIRLRECCDNAKEVMAYQDSKFDMSPEDVLSSNRDCEVAVAGDATVSRRE